MSDEGLYLQNLQVEDFSAFGASPAELVAYALDEVGLLGSHTLIAGRGGRTLVESFYRKRHKVRQNTRLGSLLIQAQIITQAHLIEALSWHVTREVPLGQALIELNFCNQSQLDSALSQQSRIRKKFDSEP